jgi:hypothetical protein
MPAPGQQQSLRQHALLGSNESQHIQTKKHLQNLYLITDKKLI